MDLNRKYNLPILGEIPTGYVLACSFSTFLPPLIVAACVNGCWKLAIGTAIITPTPLKSLKYDV
jgi:hypothetical protein